MALIEWLSSVFIFCSFLHLCELKITWQKSDWKLKYFMLFSFLVFFPNYTLVGYKVNIFLFKLKFKKTNTHKKTLLLSQIEYWRNIIHWGIEWIVNSIQGLNDFCCQRIMLKIRSGYLCTISNNSQMCDSKFSCHCFPTFPKHKRKHEGISARW